MSLINVYVILLLLLAATTGLLARTVYFDPSQSHNCFVQSRSCNFTDPQYWTGGVAPNNGDDVVFPKGRIWMDIYQNIELASIRIDNANASSILVLNISTPHSVRVSLGAVGKYVQGRFSFNSRLVYSFMMGEFRMDLYGTVTADKDLTVDGNLSITGLGSSMLTVNQLSVKSLFTITDCSGRIGSITASNIVFDELNDFIVWGGGIIVSDAVSQSPYALITNVHIHTSNLVVPRTASLSVDQSNIKIDNAFNTEATFLFHESFIDSPTITLNSHQPSSIVSSRFGASLTILGYLKRFSGAAYKDLNFLGAVVAQDYIDSFVVAGNMLINVNPATSSSGSLSTQFATLNTNELAYSQVTVRGTLTMKSKLTFAPSFATPVFGPFNATNILSFNSLVVDPSLKTPVDISDLYPKMSVVLMPNSWGITLSR